MAPAGASSSSSGMSGASPIPSIMTGRFRSRRARSRPKGNVSLLRPQRPYVAPRALETEEIPGVVEAFRRGAENAQAAGFDGVEIHGANGYLLDQFLQDGANKRTDAYGGAIENRARLMLEVTDAVVSVWGPGRVGVHLAPRGDAHDMGDSDLPATFGYVARELGKRENRLHLRPRIDQGAAARTGSSRRRSAASMSPTRASPAKRRRRRSPPAKPTRSPSASSSSPTPTCRAALRSARRSTPGTPRPSIARPRRLHRLSCARGARRGGRVERRARALRLQVLDLHEGEIERVGVDHIVLDALAPRIGNMPLERRRARAAARLLEQEVAVGIGTTT